MEIKIKLVEGGQLPQRMTEGSTYDCFVRDITYEKDGRIVHHLGFATDIEKGYRGYIYARSSLSKYQGSYIPTGLGYIDSDYRNEWLFILRSMNNLQSPYIIGSRCCQIEFRKYEEPDFIIVDSLEETDRKGGFGSTGA